MPAVLQPEYQLRQGVTWQEYIDALETREREGRRYRISYDRGRMEIMAKSFVHERLKKRSARLVETWSMERGLVLVSAGEWTLKNEEADRGLEADECYYVQHAAQALANRELSLENDPPPDLALEIEVSRSIIGRLDIYAALRVPEIWRIGEDYLIVCLLQGDDYIESEVSRAFPQLPLKELRRFLFEMPNLHENALLQAWIQWIRANVP